jgi:lactate dehydrogenase-like 2-hydroxyacid dehydrogenase
MNPQTLATKLSDKQGAVITLTDKIDPALLARCPNLKAVCNIADGGQR